MIIANLFLILPLSAAETECYFLNENGVCFQEEEYMFLTEMYWEGIQKMFTQNDYDKLIQSQVFHNEVDTVIYVEKENLRNTSYSDGKKSIKISKTCVSTNCVVATTVTWITNPNIRSYDLIGAYLENVNRLDVPSTIVVVDNSTRQNFDTVKYDNNGFGVSVLLPITTGNIKVSQTFKTSKGGTVYASYQHANKSISLINSNAYTISKNGFGNVFNFIGNVANIYDKMNGVSINV